jgi:hypothetical protein
MNNNFSDFLKIKPGDILWLIPESCESSDSCAGINESEFGVLIKSVHFSPYKKDAKNIRLNFDETEIETPGDDDDIFVSSVSIYEYQSTLRVSSSARIESCNEPTYYRDLKYSSIHIEMRSLLS